MSDKCLHLQQRLVQEDERTKLYCLDCDALLDDDVKDENETAHLRFIYG